MFYPGFPWSTAMTSEFGDHLSSVIPSNSTNECGGDLKFGAGFDRLSWHEHVYRRLPSKPTPHYIENILGLQSSEQCQASENNMIGLLNPTSNSFPVQQTLSTEIIEPLNLSVKNQIKIRTKTVKGENMVSKPSDKVEKIDNVSNVEVSEHKNVNSKSEEGRTRTKHSSSHSQSSNSSIESDTKSSIASAIVDYPPDKNFKDILKTNLPVSIPLSPTARLPSQINTTRELSLNSTFDSQEIS